MPKESLTLNGFGGGLNLDADEADIISTGEGQDEATTLYNLYADYKGKVTAEHPIIKDLTGVATCDSLTISASWENTTTSFPFTQKGSQSGGAQPPTGTGIQVICTVSSGDPTFTIVDGGSGYLVDDTIIFVDPGSTSNEATLVVATLVGTAIGVTVDTSISSTSGQCLYYADKLYQGQGIYKIAEDVVISENADYLIGKPTVGTLNDGTPDAHSDGVDLDASYDTSGDINIFKGKNATTNYEGVAIVMDKGTLGTASSGLGPRNLLAQVEDSDADGKAGEEADYWLDTSGTNALRTINASYYTDLRPDIFFMSSSTVPVDLSSTNAEVDITGLDFIMFSRNGYDPGGNIPTAGATSAVDDLTFCVFRVGKTQVADGPDTFLAGAYGTALPSIAGKTLVVELQMNSMTNIDEVVIWADSDVSGSSSDMEVWYDFTSDDPYARIWKISASELTSEGADLGYRTFEIPYEAFDRSGTDFLPTGVKMIGIGYSCNGANPAASSKIMSVRQLSFLSDEKYGWNGNNYQFYQTSINSKKMESIPFKYGPHGGGKIYEGLNYPAIFKIYKTNANAFYSSGNVYYQGTDASGAGTGPRLLLAKWDYTKGVNSVGSEGYAAWDDSSSPNFVQFQFEDPPVASTYIFESGYPEDTESVNAIWQTAAVVGRTPYIGNVAKCAAEVGIICVALGGGANPAHTLLPIDSGGTSDYFQLAQHNHPLGVTWTDWEATHGFAVNQYVIVTGFSNAANNGIFKIDQAFGDVDGGEGMINNKMFVKKIDGTVAGLQAETKTSGVVRFFGFDSTPDDTSDGIYDNSLILKGAVSKPAGFPDNQYIDLEFGGDEIIHMVSSSDRLFVFSQKKLSIINVAQDIEFLEASIPHMGVKSSTGRNVCKVGEGVAWINGTGVYFFDGEQVQPLSGDKVSTLYIDETNCAIGYDGNRSILWVWSEATKVYFYSFISQTWVGLKDFTTVGGAGLGSNVVTGAFGRSFYEDGGKHYYIGDTASGIDLSNQCELVTGKIDCGNIAQNKKFYKVIVTMKNESQMRLYWRTNVTPTTYWTVDADADDNGIWVEPNDLSTLDRDVSGTNELKLTGAKGKWIQLKFISSSSTGQAKAKAPSDMSIGDISLIYRRRIVK